MCVVSMVGDGFTEQFPQRWPAVQPYLPPERAPLDLSGFLSGVTRAEFDALKREVTELKALLKAAKKFDESTAQPHCEKPDKLKLIFVLAKAIGVDMSDLGLNESGA